MKTMDLNEVLPRVADDPRGGLVGEGEVVEVARHLAMIERELGPFGAAEQSLDDGEVGIDPSGSRE